MTQTPLRFVPTDELRKRFDTYMVSANKNNVSETLRELVDLALRIKEQATDDDSRTNRELIEKILERQYAHSRMLNNIYVNTYPYDESISNEMKQESIDKMNEMKILSEDAFNKYMGKETDN